MDLRDFGTAICMIGLMLSSILRELCCSKKSAKQREEIDQSVDKADDGKYALYPMKAFLLIWYLQWFTMQV